MAGNNPSIGTGIWTVISGGVTITDSSLFNTSVTGLATGSSAILQWTISNGNCTTSTDQITITNNPRPAITTGTVADVSTSSNTFSIPFTATTNSPDQYSITVGSPPLANFTPVSNQNLGTSPIVVTIPASAAGSYNFSLTVRNSVTGCVSAPQSVALEVVPAIIAVTASLNQFTTCEGAASDAQSFTVSGSSLTGNLTISAPLGYEISTDPVNGYSQSLTLNQSSGIVTSTTIFVRLTSTANNGASGNITFTSSSVTQNLSTGSAIVHPNPATPVFSEAFDPNQVPGTSAVCGGSSLMALLVDNPESDFTYTWTAEPSNVIIADPVNPQTAVTFPDSANGYTAIVSLQAVSPGSQGSCKSQIQQLTVNVGSSQGINEKKIVPKQPGHLLVYLDNSSDLRYRWGVDSIIYDGSRQILTNPRLISGQVFQFFAPESRFVSPANGTFPEQLDTVNYAYWVQVIKVSPTDSVICYTRVYYNGPYCSLCRGKSNGEMISSDIQAMLWPNPVRNYFDLKLSGSIYGRMDVCILNSLGQTVDQRTFIKEDAEQRFRYELKDMPSGIYQLFIRGNRGEMVNVKFINVAP